MSIQLSHKWAGVAIPSILIIYLQISTSLILYQDKTVSQHRFLSFQILSLVLWIFYYLAIKTPPGSPPRNFKIPKSELEHQTFWRKWCSKCQQYKPERTHHCKSCGKCVLKMDHHCPWTNNCVGYFNFPHFLRFLVWIMISAIYTFVYFFKKLLQVFEMWHLPSYFISKLNLSIYIVNALLLAFILLTVGILFIRCIFSTMSNQTMIESWECERLQENFYTETLWKTVRKNYKMIYPNSENSFPKLTSWKVNYRLVKKSSIVPLNFTYEDLVFPYDLGSAYQNLVDSLGPIYTWMYPFGKPKGNGVYFVKDKLEEDQLKLPFPIDGYNVDPRNATDEFIEIDDENELTLRNWSNVLGETMESFGVDPETENFKTK